MIGQLRKKSGKHEQKVVQRETHLDQRQTLLQVVENKIEVAYADNRTVKTNTLEKALKNVRTLLRAERDRNSKEIKECADIKATTRKHFEDSLKIMNEFILATKKEQLQQQQQQHATPTSTNNNTVTNEPNLTSVFKLHQIQPDANIETLFKKKRLSKKKKNEDGTSPSRKSSKAKEKRAQKVAKKKAINKN